MEMPNEINDLDSEDIGLKGIFGNRFTDATNPPEATRKASNAARAAQNPEVAEFMEKKMNIPEEPNWQPVKPDPNWYDRLKDCAKWVCVCGGLCVLFFYWQQTGQMLPSAAFPSVVVCALLAGFGVGKNAIKR